MTLQATIRPQPTTTQNRPLKLVRLLLALALTISFLGLNVEAQAPPTEEDVKAAYLFNFGRFVEWPQQPDSTSEPFTICILGNDDFGRTLDSLIANEVVQGRPILAKRISSVAAADTCQIVFLGLSEQARLTKDLDALRDKPILTVSSLPGFMEHGGMIQFLLQNNRVRFAVNLSSAARARVVLSSELLKVAVYVNSRLPQEGR